MRYLSICAIFKNEARFLDEWLHFHRGVGVEHFYLYDNDSADDFEPVLNPWISMGVVTHHSIPGPARQLRAYAHCLKEHGGESRWIAFIDLDEFLFATDFASLPQILASFERFPGVGINGLGFGSNGHVRRPTGHVTANYIRRADLSLTQKRPEYLRPGGDPTQIEGYYPWSAHIKSIADPSRTIRPRTPHSFAYADGEHAVDETERPIASPLRDVHSQAVSVGRLRINHYWSRSLADLRDKLARDRLNPSAPRTADWAFRFETWLNAVEDRTILPLAQRLLPRLP